MDPILIGYEPIELARFYHISHGEIWWADRPAPTGSRPGFGDPWLSFKAMLLTTAASERIVQFVILDNAAKRCNVISLRTQPSSTLVTVKPWVVLGKDCPGCGARIRIPDLLRMIYVPLRYDGGARSCPASHSFSVPCSQPHKSHSQARGHHRHHGLSAQAPRFAWTILPM